jgi:hypothetical protein
MASPKVSIYMTREQAEAALSALRWMAEGNPKSNPLWRAIAHVEEALAENA